METTLPDDVVGLIPAAGLANRLGRMPCSKELLPVWSPEPGALPKPACLCLIEAMSRIGIDRAHVVLRNGKWDIPAYLGNGSEWGIHLSYLMMGRPWGAPFTLDQAFAFLGESVVAVGFPDILFQPPDPFRPLLARLAKGGCEVVLGLFRNHPTRAADTVELDATGRVLALSPKPGAPGADHSWGLAVWSPRMTRFIHRKLQEFTEEPVPELSLGYLLEQARVEGLELVGLPVSSEPFLDLGTPEGLLAAMRDSSAV